MSTGAVKVGKIFRIDIEVHWTLIALFLFIIFAVPDANQLILLLTLFLLLFICVLIHEIAHSFTSIKNGIKVNGILLTPFGGATIIDNTSISAGLEFRIALVGPIMSLLLGGIFGVVVIFSPPGIFTYVLQSLFVLNIALGVLNLLPTFPMDGGRIFRSYLERKNSRFNATMKTVRASNYMAFLFLIASAIYIFVINQSWSFGLKAVDLLLFFFVVFIMYEGAQGEKENALIRRDTANLTINDAVSKSFVLVNPSLDIRKLYDIVKRKKAHIILTRSGKEFMLIDIYKKRQAAVSKVSDLAIPIPTFSSNINILDALIKLEGNNIGIAAVVKADRPIGVVTAQHLQALISLHILKLRRKGFNS